MPRLDKTGPEGKGPKTGRGLGDCNKNLNPRIGREDGGEDTSEEEAAGRNWGFRNRRNDIEADKEIIKCYRQV